MGNLRLNRRPVPAVHDPVDGGECDAESLCYHAQLHAFFLAESVNLTGLRFGKARGTVGLSARLVRSPLACAIRHVRSLIANEEVIRVATSPVVTGVASEQPGRNRANHQLVHQPVNKDLLSVDVRHSISGVMNAPRPNPTAVSAARPINRRKQSNQDVVSGKIGHVSLLQRLTAPRVFTAPRGILSCPILPEMSPLG